MYSLTPILKKQNGGLNENSTPGLTKKVVFEEESVHEIVTAFRISGNPFDYSPMITALKKDPTDQVLNYWLDGMTVEVVLLDKRVEKLVEDFLKVNWFSYNEEISLKFKHFLISLVTAHNYYNYPCLRKLFSMLLPEISPQLKTKADPGVINIEEERKYAYALSSIVAILKEVPLSSDAIIKLAHKFVPYMRAAPHLHLVYAQNLLHLTSDLPQLRRPILEIILLNMVNLDVHAPRSDLLDEKEEDDDDDDDEEQFKMDVESSNNNCTLMENDIGCNLDLLMDLMLRYVHEFCHGFDYISWDKKDSEVKCPVVKKSTDKSGCECNGSKHNFENIKKIYTDIKLIFSDVILRTHHTCHVQFLLFYLLAIRPGLVSSFMEFLFDNTFKNVNCIKDARNKAVSYLGSLLARGKFIPFISLHSWLEMLCNWCMTYVDNQKKSGTRYYEDINLHSNFYHACQTIFYVFTFRYGEYTDSSNPRRLNQARNLGMDKLVTCKLNPLKVCSPAIVNNFALVTRRFELVYCFTIIANNKRSILPTISIEKYTSQLEQISLIQFFPFDPYLLIQSKRYIEPHYKEFEGLPEDDCTTDEENMETDGDELSKSLCFSFGSCEVRDRITKGEDEQFRMLEPEQNSNLDKPIRRVR